MKRLWLVMAVALAACGEDGGREPACADEERQAAADRCGAVGGEFEGEGEAEAACGADGRVGGTCTVTAGTCLASCALPLAHRMCGTDVTPGEIALLFSGTVVLVAEQAEAGTSAYELLARVVAQMLYRGITFSALDDPEIDFEDGRYSFDTGRSSVGFRLTWARDFNGHRAGDPIEHNVFDPRSYVSDVTVSVGGSIANPRLEYDFEPGPLAELVDGDIDFDGRDPRSLSARVKLFADAVAIAIDSHGVKRFEVPVWETAGFLSTLFDLDIRQVSSPLAVPDVVDALHEGRFVLSWAGTRIRQTWRFLGQDFFHTDDAFASGDFAIGEDEEGNGWFEGEYTSAHAARFEAFDVERTGRLFTRGFLSTRSQNTTTLYCDEGRADLWGTARHHLDLSGGVLTLAGGETIDYGLRPVSEDEEESED